MDPSTNIVDQFKKGWKTSEFWVALVALIAPMAAALSDYNIDTQQLGLAVGGVASALIYIFSRTWLKRKRIDGVIVATNGTTPVEPLPVIEEPAPAEPTTPTEG